MRKVVKWAGFGLGGVMAATLLAAGGVFLASEAIIRAPQIRPATRLVATRGADAVARGHRVAVVQGCTDCHGANLQGRMFDDIPNVVTMYAPNLTLTVGRQSDADLDRAIRHGVGADGRPLWIMPSSAFAHLTDGETADLIAYLRTVPPQGPPQPTFRLGPVGRLGVLIGQFKSEPAIIKARENPALPDLGPQVAAGRQVARACVECHGPALKGTGGPGLVTPDLNIAAAYDLADFDRLLRTGVAAGNRQVGVMSLSSRARFPSLTAQEIADLHGYLKARAGAAVETTSLPKT